MSTVPPVLFPIPRTLRPDDGLCLLPPQGVDWIACDEPLATPVVLDLFSGAIALAGATLRRGGMPMIRLERASLLPAEGYRLAITVDGIRIEAADAAGAQHAAVTLRQLARQCPQPSAFACLSAEDFPDFSRRGIMLDISRDKVPTMATLFGLVDRMVEMKLNEIQLYTEHTFAYVGHREVWRYASPMTADEVRALGAYCRARHIDLVPNQNSFGHLERWLKLPAYADLAEAPDGFRVPWGLCAHPFSLCPTDPRCEAFVAGLLEELLPNFDSACVNVGCDETFDVGQGRSKEAVEQRGGRVYLDFLKKIQGIAAGLGKRIQFWGDIILCHPELIPEIPKDVVGLVWGYEADHPFEAQCAAFAASGLDFYVCPGTSSWRSITGRTDNALANLRSAAVHGQRTGAKGYLITDWGDGGHWQCLPVSYAGYAYGAAQAWAVDANASVNLPAALDLHVFLDTAGQFGRIVCELGNLYRSEGVPSVGNGTLYFQALQTGWDLPMAKLGVQADPYRRAVARAFDLALQLAGTRLHCADADLLREEFTHLADLARWGLELCAARAGNEGQTLPPEWDPGSHGLPSITEVMERHSRLWLARNRPGGLAESLAHMETLQPSQHDKETMPR